MMALRLPADFRSVLCIGAHCDDIEIGCGGLLATLAHERQGLRVSAAIFSGTEVRRAESRRALQTLCAGAAQCEVRFFDFEDGRFPADWGRIKAAMGEVSRGVSPDLILAPAEHDRHQDHETLARLIGQEFRDHLVLGYEIPKYDADLGSPSVYFPLARRAVDIKVKTLMSVFETQLARPWFTADVFESVMRLRGIESRAADGFAEGFYSRKMVLGF